MIRLEAVDNTTKQKVAVMVAKESNIQLTLTNKFRGVPKSSSLWKNGHQLPTENIWNHIEQGDVIWVVKPKDPYHGPSPNEDENLLKKKTINFMEGEDLWIDPEAVRQVQAIASIKDVVKVSTMPDLHFGPVGIAVLSENPHPKFPGYDIGCGMGLYSSYLDAHANERTRAKWMKSLHLDDSTDPDDPDMGTIGGGNHFAEILAPDPEHPIDQDALPSVSHDRCVVLVHTGSRSRGQELFDRCVGLDEPQEIIDHYIPSQLKLLEWARKNRATVATKLLRQLGQLVDDGEDGAMCILDMPHNFIEPIEDPETGKTLYLHRKGAAPARKGKDLTLLPGSRGTASYVLKIREDNDEALEKSLFSVAHGAGRRLKRKDARKRRYPRGYDLTQGNTVVCCDKDLLAEEAPAAYKDVETVVKCLIDNGLCTVAARLLPLGTYKMRDRYEN